MILGPQGPGKVGQRGGFSYTRTAAHGQRHAGVAQLVEHYLAKVDVASSNLVSRSTLAPTSTERGGISIAPLCRWHAGLPQRCHTQSRGGHHRKRGDLLCCMCPAWVVPRAGLEPARLAAADFKSDASTIPPSRPIRPGCGARSRPFPGTRTL